MGWSYRKAGKGDGDLLAGIYDAAFYSGFAAMVAAPAMGGQRSRWSGLLRHTPNTSFPMGQNPVGAVSQHPGWRRIELATLADKREKIRFCTEKCGCRLGGRQEENGVALVALYLKRGN